MVGTSRVISRDIQRIKVMKTVFYFRAGFYGKTQLAKKLFDSGNGARYRVQVTV